MVDKVLFSSASQHWETPFELYVELYAEFQFNDDPCPRNPTSNGLEREWGSSTYCNPPYGREITKWIKKGYEESQKGKTVVFLIPSRTDTRWWQTWIMKSTKEIIADEVRFLPGRLKFSNAKNSAPFPSAIVVYRGSHG